MAKGKTYVYNYIDECGKKKHILFSAVDWQEETFMYSIFDGELGECGKLDFYGRVPKQAIVDFMTGRGITIKW